MFMQHMGRFATLATGFPLRQPVCVHEGTEQGKVLLLLQVLHTYSFMVRSDNRMSVRKPRKPKGRNHPGDTHVFRCGGGVLSVRITEHPGHVLLTISGQHDGPMSKQDDRAFDRWMMPLFEPYEDDPRPVWIDHADAKAPGVRSQAGKRPCFRGNGYGGGTMIKRAACHPPDGWKRMSDEGRVFDDMLNPAFDPGQFRLYRGQWPNGKWFDEKIGRWVKDQDPVIGCVR